MNCRRKKNRKKKENSFSYVLCCCGKQCKIHLRNFNFWLNVPYFLGLCRKIHFFIRSGRRSLTSVGRMTVQEKSENEFVARRATFARLEASTRVRFIEDEMNRQNLWLHYSFSSRRAVALIRWTINVNFPAPSTMPRYVRNLFPFKAT